MSVRKSAVETALEAWTLVPEWVFELAAEVDRQGSQRRVAQTLDVSPAVVNQVIRSKYPAGLERIEERVRTLLMRAKVVCPELGEIERMECLDIQARPFAATNPARVRLFRACRTGCAHNKTTV